MKKLVLTVASLAALAILTMGASFAKGDCCNPGSQCCHNGSCCRSHNHNK